MDARTQTRARSIAPLCGNRSQTAPTYAPASRASERAALATRPVCFSVWFRDARHDQEKGALDMAVARELSLPPGTLGVS